MAQGAHTMAHWKDGFDPHLDHLISRCSVMRLRNLLYFFSSSRPEVFLRFCASQSAQVSDCQPLPRLITSNFQHDLQNHCCSGSVTPCSDRHRVPSTRLIPQEMRLESDVTIPPSV